MIGCGVMSGIWGMILQSGSNIKVSNELPVTTRHHRDMTEKLLKATSGLNKQQHFLFGSSHIFSLIICRPNFLFCHVRIKNFL